MKDKLNPRQKKFAEYYAQSGNTVQSAIKAGYSENYANSRAYELLDNVGISEYIQKIAEKLKDQRILTAKDRQIILSDIANDSLSEPGDRIKAIDTLNKMTGEYVKRVDVSMGLQTAKDKLDAVLGALKDG